MAAAWTQRAFPPAQSLIIHATVGIARWPRVSDPILRPLLAAIRETETAIVSLHHVQIVDLIGHLLNRFAIAGGRNIRPSDRQAAGAGIRSWPASGTVIARANSRTMRRHGRVLFLAGGDARKIV